MDKPLTTPEQRRALEAKGWVFYYSNELDGVREASIEEWLSPRRETVVALGFEGPYAAYDLPGPWSEEYCKYPADPSNVLEFCAIIGWAPKGYVLVPIEEAVEMMKDISVAAAEAYAEKCRCLEVGLSVAALRAEMLAEERAKRAVNLGEKIVALKEGNA